MFIDRMASNKTDSIHSVINRCAYRASEQSRPRRGCEAKPKQTYRSPARV